VLFSHLPESLTGIADQVLWSVQIQNCKKKRVFEDYLQGAAAICDALVLESATF
jgi:hypothetical protein